jgi:hypothetical protein
MCEVVKAGPGFQSSTAQRGLVVTPVEILVSQRPTLGSGEYEPVGAGVAPEVI